MTTVTISDSAAEALRRIAKLRGLHDEGEALLEAIGTEEAIANELNKKGRILVRRKSGEMRELVF